ncbi:MAG: hypothetical protein ACK540_03475, partial [Betaproteobacteria bacterium]
MGAPTINLALKQILQPHVPFSQMAVADIEFLLSHVEVAYYAPGETVLSPSPAVAEYCWIVKQGGVRGLQPRSGRTDEERIAFE